MTDPRHRVRVAESFFEQPDELLPADRGPAGEPSATDFLVIDLPSIVDRSPLGSTLSQKSSRASPPPAC